LRALVVPVRFMPENQFINSTISIRVIFCGVFQSRMEARNSRDCVRSALYARIDSFEKLFPVSALRNNCCPCSIVMFNIGLSY
jgi:hypothetical protein